MRGHNIWFRKKKEKLSSNFSLLSTALTAFLLSVVYLNQKLLFFSFFFFCFVAQQLRDTFAMQSFQCFFLGIS